MPENDEIDTSASAALIVTPVEAEVVEPEPVKTAIVPPPVDDIEARLARMRAALRAARGYVLATRGPERASLMLLLNELLDAEDRLTSRDGE